MRLRRVIASVVIAWAVAVRLSAQEATVNGGVPRLPPIGLPLAPIGLPLPPIGLTTPQSSQSVEPTRVPIAGRGHRLGRRRSPIVVLPAPVIVQPVVVLHSGVGDSFGVRDSFGVGDCAGSACEPSPRRSSQPVRGRLRVDAEPRTARIYVDGNFMGGSVEGGNALELEPGMHTLEIAADGHESVHETVLVTAGSRLVYRAALEPNPPQISEPRGPVTFYVVPGCYAGDVPPAQVQLPAGCDAAKAVSVTRF